MRRHLRTHDVTHWRIVSLRHSAEAGQVSDARCSTARLDCAHRSCSQLLVACDYDGTLARSIVADPSAARSASGGRRRHPVAGVAAPQTTVAVVSGRALRDSLRVLSRLPSEVHLVGSHGSEFDVGFVERMTPETLELRGPAGGGAGRADHRPGRRCALEAQAGLESPCTCATPLRIWPIPCSTPCAPALSTWPDIHVTQRQAVVELSVIATNKGTAIDALRMQLSASAVMFLVTDCHRRERVQAAARAGPVASRSARARRPRPSRSRIRPKRSACWPWFLAARRAWLYGERAVADRAALDSLQRAHRRPGRAGLHDHLAVRPQTGLLGRLRRPVGRPAGRSRSTVAPADRDGLPLGQRYRSGTMTVETRWSGLTVTDWSRRGVRMGARRSSGSCSGTGRAKIEFAPRTGIRAVWPYRSSRSATGAGARFQRADRAALPPGIEWSIVDEGGHETARATVDLDALGGRCELDSDSAPRVWRLLRSPSVIGRRPPRRRSREWSASLRLADGRPAIWCCAARSRCVACATRRPVRFWPRRPRRCPRRSAASATGTIATAWLRDASMSARALCRSRFDRRGHRVPSAGSTPV